MKLIKLERIQKIHEYVSEKQAVSLDELVSVFDVSKNTIRRDIQWLADHGEIKKVYGGIAVNDTSLVSFNDRQIRNQKQKALVGKLAASFIDNGDIVFIDSGTTTVEMFEFLKNKEITIITGNLNFIINAQPFDNLNVISIGGMLERKTNSFVCFKETNLLSMYNINKAFMASTGISLTNGVTNASPQETELKRTAVKRSSEVFLVIDHDKFDRNGLMTYCNLDDIDYLVTDTMPSEKYIEYARDRNVRIVTP